MVYNPTACAVASLCFLVASWVFTGVRLYVRVHLRKGPFLDDFLAVVALILFTVYSIILIYCQFKDNTPLAMDSSPEYGQEGLKFFFICDIFYSFGTYIIKLSFTCTLLRLVQTRTQYLVLFAVIVPGAVITVVAVIHAALYCKPASYHRTRSSNPNVELRDHCDIFWSSMVATLIQAVWIMLADIVLGPVAPRTHALPDEVLHPLHPRPRLYMSRVNITTIIRLIYLGLASNPAITATIVPMAFFWSLLEQAISILCVSASTWKPLFVKLGLVDPRDNHSPVRLNTQDEEVFGTTQLSGTTATSSRTGWSVPIVHIFHEPERKAEAGFLGKR
ncbi:hypothetical protein BDW62DRAFT_196650 [Aspergillus aurantiobrunneus]